MRTLYTAAATALVLGLSIGTASARDIGFTVVNKTDAGLEAFYAGPSSTEDWGDNLLEYVVEDGETMSVTISDADTCLFDFRYEVEGKEPYEEYEIDICEIDGERFTIK